jgi:signal transduction histidine kinase
MKRGIFPRLFIFIATITLLVLMIGWLAHTSWQRTNELQVQLSAKQWKSFQIADHMQQSILAMDNLMLRYAAYHEEADWNDFSASSVALGSWLADQQPLLSSEKERPYLEQINVAYRDYQTAAAALNRRIYGARQNTIRFAEFSDLEKYSRRILDLSIQLSEAHQQLIDAMEKQNLVSLSLLRLELLFSLVILVAAGAWLSWVVYRELITPLRVQLVESRHMVERQEKLASLGMLATGVAHEIRNPITAIKAWLFLQEKHMTPGSPEYADAKIISSEVDRLERIVKDFLQFARPSDPQFNLVPAEQPLREAQTLMRLPLEKSNIKLVLAEVAPVQVRIDPQQIKQVLINLIQNAAESIGHHGRVTLRARVDYMRINDQPAEVVILEVSDTGKGISEEVGKRLFDPFFTTKDFGTGLGLPIAARIVEKHNGALQYQNRPEGGTTFGIILPRHAL